MSPDIKIRTLTGAAIRTYIPSIAKLRMEILKEFPYLIAGSPEEDAQYLKRLSQSKDSIAILVFDGPKIIGVSTGIPLKEERPQFQKPFLEKSDNPADYYYFGVSALLKEYRGRGLAHHFFDLREHHVKNLKRYKKICFTIASRPQNHPKRPLDYVPLDAFWKKRGYIEHQNLIATFPWREIEEETPSPKKLHFWTKNL